MATILNIANNFFNSWHGVAALLGSIFILVTANSWTQVIDRLTFYLKKKDLVISANPMAEQADVMYNEDYAKIQATLSDLNIHADREFQDFLTSVKQHLLQRNLNRQEVRELIRSIFTIKEQYEFAYLNLFLVANSKAALKRLAELGSATKKLFLTAMDLPSDIADESNQQEVIFNALLCHHLIENGEGIYQVSEKGRRFLEFIGWSYPQYALDLRWTKVYHNRYQKRESRTSKQKTNF